MAKKAQKYIFVTGGVLSGLGKGITAASIARILKSRGLSVNIQKCDPYLNVDAGTLNPREHGECFVTKDGAETDLDLGHYERFIDEELTQGSSLMAGRVLRKVIQDERDGKYGGDDVQIIPHLTEAIQGFIERAGEGYDVHIVEIGGTVGDYESLSFTEAIRSLGERVGPANCVYVHVVYLPFLGTSKETKTKPAQNSVRELRGLGITPDILIARSEKPPVESVKAKLSMFSGVPESAIALLPNADSIYEVPLTLEDTDIAEHITKKLALKVKKADLTEWRGMVKKIVSSKTQTIDIGIVAKYMENEDTYKSVFEALEAAGWSSGVDVRLSWVNAEDIESGKLATSTLKQYDGIVVPGGFGTRGVEGKVMAAQWALKNKKPYLGLCLGMQVAVIAAARNAGLKDATSEELDQAAKTAVIHTMDGQRGKQLTGGTMRLGDYPCKLVSGSKAAEAYSQSSIIERHRHRLEANNAYRDNYEQWGIKASGLSPDGALVEVIEAIDHPFMVASQFHPEFKSRPNKPHPLFSMFVATCITTNGGIKK